MSFINNKDYYSKAILVFSVLGFYYFSKEYSNSIVLTLVVTGIGGALSFYIVSKLANKSTQVKIVSLLITLLFFMMVVYISVKAPLKNSVKKSTYTGTWLSDDSDGFTVKFRLTEFNAYLSMSPEYEEIEYTYSFKNDSLYLNKEGITKFVWLFKPKDHQSFELQNAKSTLEFHRK